jgi:hypothetical protein
MTVVSPQSPFIALALPPSLADAEPGSRIAPSRSSACHRSRQ